MKTLTDDQFYKLIKETWEFDNGEFEDFLSKAIAHVIKAELISKEEIDTGEHSVYFAVFKNPQCRITPGQLCELFDEGNHCISNGSIVYENNYAYIIWSNLGHI